jgi:phosphoenolpyruvate-protein phosphotransferase
MPSRELSGVGAAPGVAIGPVWRHDGGIAGGVPVPDVRRAAEIAASQLTALAERVRAAGRTADAEIFDAQAMMAEDPMLLDDLDARLAANQPPSADGVAAVVEEVAAEHAAILAGLPDETLAARASDVLDVGARIARVVAGRAIEPPDRPSIVVADDLAPSLAAEIGDGLLLGIAIERGSATSHAAILARGLGIPAVVGVRGLLEESKVGAAGARSVTTIGLDGGTGRVILDPTDDDRASLDAIAARRTAQGEIARSLRGQPGRTADGRPVALLANIGRPEDSARAIEAGAEGVGLFRTEFLYVGRQAAPSEDEQAAAYRSVLDAFGSRPVVIRLLDVGGDKPLPYLRLAPEANPFLGIRGFRLARDHRELLMDQLRAIARAGAGAPSVPRVMAPMVATVEDVEHVHELVTAAFAELDAAGVPRAPHLEVGIMIEVPSAALMAAELARRVAFFSIGSNDLTQYVLAMDRGHPDLAAAADALHPAVLRAIRATVEGAAVAGIEVAVCGELAGDPAGSLVLAGLGIGELSMDAGSLDAVRLGLASATDADLRELARQALAATSAAEVRGLAAAFMARPATRD